MLWEAERTGEAGMREWIAEECPALTLDGKMLGTMLRREQELVRCKDCKWRSFYCTEATDGTTLYECHHPCADNCSRPWNWFCADGIRRESE